MVRIYCVLFNWQHFALLGIHIIILHLMIDGFWVNEIQLVNQKILSGYKVYENRMRCQKMAEPRGGEVLQKGDLRRSFWGCMSQNPEDRNESCSKKSIPRWETASPKALRMIIRGIFSQQRRLVFLSTAKADVMIFLSPVCFSNWRVTYAIQVLPFSW